MEVLYRRVFMDSRPPTIEARYDTDHGVLLWTSKGWVDPDDPTMHYNTVKHWMEPIKEF